MTADVLLILLRNDQMRIATAAQHELQRRSMDGPPYERERCRDYPLTPLHHLCHHVQRTHLVDDCFGCLFIPVDTCPSNNTPIVQWPASNPSVVKQTRRMPISCSYEHGAPIASLPISHTPGSTKRPECSELTFIED